MNTINTYRIRNKLTFNEMAIRCGFRSRSTVLQHCYGERGISAESAKKYNAAFGIPLSELRPDLWPHAENSAEEEPDK